MYKWCRYWLKRVDVDLGSLAVLFVPVDVLLLPDVEEVALLRHGASPHPALLQDLVPVMTHLPYIKPSFIRLVSNMPLTLDRTSTLSLHRIQEVFPFYIASRYIISDMTSWTSTIIHKIEK